MDHGSVQYFRQRERMERLAAKNAATLEARRAHQELAQLYATRLRSEGSNDDWDRSNLSVVSA